MKDRWRSHKETKFADAKWYCVSDFCECECGRQYIVTAHVRTEGDGAAFVDAMSFNSNQWCEGKDNVPSSHSHSIIVVVGKNKTDVFMDGNRLVKQLKESE